MQIDFASFPFHCATGEYWILQALSIVSCVSRDTRVELFFSFETKMVGRGMNAMRISKRIDRAIFYNGYSRLLLFRRMKYRIY